MINENAVENTQVSDPYFINETIDFIHYPFLPIDDKFIYPRKVEKFLYELAPSITHVKLEVVNDDSNMVLRAIVGTISDSLWAQLKEPDATKIKILLRELAIDYTPQTIIKEFIGNIKDDDIINHAQYDLHRFEQWVQDKSNRTFKQEFFYRFGIIT